MRKLLVKYLLISALMFQGAGITLANDLIGQPAPDFALRSIDSGNLRLSEFRSEVVVLTFWSDWCGKCRSALPVLKSLHAQYEDAGLQMLAVDIDGDVAKAREFAIQNGIEYPVLADTKQAVSRAYDLNKMPLSVVVDREGNIRFIHAGFSDDDGQLLAAEVADLLTE